MEVEKQAEIATTGQEDRLSKPIGTIEPVKLGEKPVSVLKVEIHVQKKKDTAEVIGEIIQLTCKHPDQKPDETMVISKATVLKNQKLKESGLWYNEDTNKEIVKSSVLAAVMNHYNVTNLNGFIGKELQTVANKEGYLGIKGF